MAAAFSPHPYYPRDVSIPNYVANTADTISLLAAFFLAAAAVVAAALAAAASARPSLAAWEKLAFVWFVVCGSCHTFFEGYFAAFQSTIAGDNSLFGQLWKEYALADSRYLTGDPTVLYIERITAFVEGPLCFLCARAILRNLPYRHPLQLLISLGQLYGTILYFATSLHAGNRHCTPDAYYLWFYFGFMNALWIMMPGALIYKSYVAMTRAMSIAGNYISKKKSTGIVRSLMLKEKEQ